jgi:hypothetical protein
VSYYYTHHGYALVTENSPSPHHFGGDVYHDGATCPVCKIPLLLLADFDCHELRKLENKKLFLELDRLPLYYCWRCCAEKLSYQVRDNSIKIFKNEGKPQGDDFPYAGFPDKFPQRPITLKPIPYEIEKLLAVAQEIDRYWLTDEDRVAIQTGLQPLRHAYFTKSGFNRHQIGGLLNLIQSHEYIVCPNPECKHHQLAKRHFGTRMMELATLQNDPHSGLPMCERLEELSAPDKFNEFIQVVFWICEECLTIAVSNRCD